MLEGDLCVWFLQAWPRSREEDESHETRKRSGRFVEGCVKFSPHITTHTSDKGCSAKYTTQQVCVCVCVPVLAVTAGEEELQRAHRHLPNKRQRERVCVGVDVVTVQSLPQSCTRSRALHPHKSTRWSLRTLPAPDLFLSGSDCARHALTPPLAPPSPIILLSSSALPMKRP